jgi:hypothetical protein
MVESDPKVRVVAHHVAGIQLVGFLDAPSQDELTNLPDVILPARQNAVGVVRGIAGTAGPESFFSQRKPLLLHAAEERCAEIAVPQMKRLRVPILSGILIPEPLVRTRPPRLSRILRRRRTD